MKKYLSIALALAALTAAGAAPVLAQSVYPRGQSIEYFPASRGQNTDYLPASPWGGPGSTTPQFGPGCGVACER